MPLSSIADGGATFLVLLLPVLFGVLILAGLIFWVRMLVDAITNKALSDADRIVWVLVIVFVHAIGALIYYFVARSNRPGATRV